jgi:hypothetical protein
MSNHACRWCGTHNCPDRWEHERLWGSGETYARMSLAQRMACPAAGCGQPVIDGRPCVAASSHVGATVKAVA